MASSTFPGYEKYAKSSLLPFRDDAWAIHKYKLTPRFFPICTPESLTLVLLPSHAAVLCQPQRISSLNSFRDRERGTMHGSPRGHERSNPRTWELNCLGGIQTLCWTVTKARIPPPPACITLQFSNIKAGRANSEHNPVLALSHKHKSLPEQDGTASQVKNGSYELPWST